MSEKNKINLIRNATVLALSCALVSPIALADRGKVAAQKYKVIAGKGFTFTKYVDGIGNVRSDVRNSKGVRISDKLVPKGKVDKIDPRVIALLKKYESNGLVRKTIVVNVALDLPLDFGKEALESGEVEVLNGLTVRGTINSKKMSGKGLNSHVARQINEQNSQRTAKNKKRGGMLAAWAKRHDLLNIKGVAEAAKQGRSGATLHLTTRQLRSLIKSNDTSIVAIELFEKNEDDITQAMADTNITNWALPYSSTRGSGIGIFMTESGCANESRITNYDRLSGSETNHSRNVGAIIRTVSPNSYLYCRGGAVLPQNSDLNGVGGNSPIYIITRSNSSNDTTSYNTLDRDWDNYSYSNNVIILNSGGNTGNGTGNVRSPGKGLNIVTVGNYNDSNNTIVSSSPFVDPQTGNDKPEIATPGANITAGGFTYTGTSQATPHAAAFVADMMSSSTYLKNKPYLAKAKLLAGATDSISGGYSKVGLGGIDFRSAQWSGYYQWYSGGNSSFTTFDANDGNSDGYVEKRIYISSSWNKARVVLSWMNRGTYTYNNRNNANSIGMDLDLKVYDPNGAYVGGSYSWDNSFEKVNFIPSVSGYYKFKIKRYSNRDTSSNLRMGLYVNYYD